MMRLTIALVLGVLAQQTLADEPEAIVGGQRAVPGEFPYQCSMTVYGEHSCGCSILSSTKVLTAAHCVDGVPTRDLGILTGSIHLNQGKKHAVKSAVMHPRYIPKQRYSWVNDIAVITVSDPIQFDRYTSPVKLADSSPEPGTQCVLSGWGMMRANGPLPSELLKMPTAVVSKDRCEREQQGMTIFTTQLCAFTKRGVGACQGDSGGPLVCNGHQHGITSWVAPCARGVPDVYTKVHSYLGFINEQMGRP